MRGTSVPILAARKMRAMVRALSTVFLSLLVSSALAADDLARLAIDPSGRHVARSQGPFIEVTGLQSKTKEGGALQGSDPAWTADSKSLVVADRATAEDPFQLLMFGVNDGSRRELTNPAL